MHYIVTKINSQLELLENSMSYVDVIDDNGNIVKILGHLFRRLSYSIISYLDVSLLDE